MQQMESASMDLMLLSQLADHLDHFLLCDKQEYRVYKLQTAIFEITKSVG
jgi:hypothetical protein